MKKKLKHLKKTLSSHAQMVKNSPVIVSKELEYHNSNTEIFAIWSFLYISVVSMFFLAIPQGVVVLFVVLILSLVLVIATGVLTISYLHRVQYGKKDSMVVKVHNFVNSPLRLSFVSLILLPIAVLLSVVTSTLRNIKNSKLRILQPAS